MTRSISYIYLEGFMFTVSDAQNPYYTLDDNSNESGFIESFRGLKYDLTELI